MKTKFIFITLLIFCFSENILAQNFKLEAKLGNVAESNFYKIKLSPEIISAMENYPNDIRIFDEQGNEIPYLFKNYEYTANIESLKYESFDKISIKKFKNQTVIYIYNSKKYSFSLFYIMYKNARKGYDLMLYGGNRKNNMKAISIKKKLVKYNNQGSLIEFIYFQACTYKYFEIRIDKYANVSKAGYIHQKTPDKSYVRLSLPEIQQKLIKNSKNSQIQISYNIPQRIDLLKINISGTDFYYRDANLSIKDSSFYKKKKKYYYRQIIRFKLNSDCTPFVYLNDFRAETFYLDIENKDNLPLKIDSIECYQKKHYLIAKLENNKSYFLRCGNSRTTKAQYDLQYFTDKIPKHLKTLKISETKHIHPIAKKTDKGFEPDKKVIWIVIIFISIILLYITVKMLKNTDN